MAFRLTRCWLPINAASTVVGWRIWLLRLTRFWIGTVWHWHSIHTVHTWWSRHVLIAKFRIWTISTRLTSNTTSTRDGLEAASTRIGTTLEKKKKKTAKTIHYENELIWSMFLVDDTCAKCEIFDSFLVPDQLLVHRQYIVQSHSPNNQRRHTKWCWDTLRKEEREWKEQNFIKDGVSRCWEIAPRNSLIVSLITHLASRDHSYSWHIRQAYSHIAVA